jgi:hypothetical protein
MAMWQARQNAPPTPNALLPRDRECKAPPPRPEVLRARSQPGEPVLLNENVNNAGQIAEQAEGAGVEPGNVPVRTSRSAWRPPAELPSCPFDSDQPCCRKLTPCYKYFKSDQATWRSQFLYNSTENEGVTAQRLAEHRLQSKLPSGKQYCVNYQTYWTGWSRAKLNTSPPRADARDDFFMTQPRDKVRSSTKDIAVIAWFSVLKDCLERMPDVPFYQIGAPMKSDVYKWYQADQIRLPTIYPHMHSSYFNKVWRTHVPEVRLRRVLRFTKCRDCETLREKRWDRSTSQLQRDEAYTDLQNHYKFVKGERGYALVKARRGVINPKNVLSMAQDGKKQVCSTHFNCANHA